MALPATELRYKQDDAEDLSRSWDWHVRRKVAWSADTSEKILDLLARDRVQWVREAVALSLIHI